MFSINDPKGARIHSQSQRILAELLAEAVIAYPDNTGLNAGLEQRMTDALSALPPLQLAVLKRRFGLRGFRAMSYHDISLDVSRSLAPGVRAELARQRGIPRDKVVIEVQEIREIERAALRDLRNRTALMSN